MHLQPCTASFSVEKWGIRVWDCSLHHIWLPSPRNQPQVRVSECVGADWRALIECEINKFCYSALQRPLSDLYVKDHRGFGGFVLGTGVLFTFSFFPSYLSVCLSVLLCLFFTSTFNIDPAFFDWSLFFCLSAFVCLFLKVSHFFCISLVRLQSIYPILSFFHSFFLLIFCDFSYFLLQSCVKAKSFIIFLFFILLFFVRHSFLSFFFILSGYHHQFYLSVFCIVFHIVFPFFHISFVLY